MRKLTLKSDVDVKLVYSAGIKIIIG